MDDTQHDLIGACAVNALHPDERLAFEQHLATCDDCRNELIGFGDTLAELSADYEVEPPASLRGAVLSAVAGLPGATSGNAPAHVAGPSARESEPDATLPEPTPLPRRIDEPAADSDSSPDSADDTGSATVTPLQPRSSGRSRWQVLVAAAIAVVAVIGISVWQPWAQHAVTAADVLAAPDAVRATTPAKGGGTVTVVRSNQLGKAVMITDDLPNAPSGKAYQAWLQQPPATMVSGGMLPVGSDVTVLLEGDARNTLGAGVSIEPPGGSAQPSKDVVALVEF